MWSVFKTQLNWDRHFYQSRQLNKFRISTTSWVELSLIGRCDYVKNYNQPVWWPCNSGCLVMSAFSLLLRRNIQFLSYFLDSLPFCILNSLLLYYLLSISYKHGLSHHNSIISTSSDSAKSARTLYDYADLTSLSLYDFSVSKWVSIDLVHRCIAQQCMTL